MVVYTLEQHWKVGLQATYRKCRFWQKKNIFSDEAQVDLGGYVNKQNCHIWGTENPHAYIEKPTHPKQVTVWCGFWSRNIIRPFFFKRKARKGCYIQWRSLSGMLNEFLFLKIEEEDIGNIWFQHEGVTCHTAEAILDVLRLIFEDLIISRRAEVL